MLFKQVRFEMTFEGWQGRAKPDIKGYVVPNFRCEVTKRPLGKLIQLITLTPSDTVLYQCNQKYKSTFYTVDREMYNAITKYLKRPSLPS